MRVSPFYPVSCQPLLSRRQLLLGGGALLATAALGRGLARASDDGLSIIHKYATRPDDPWAMAHGVRAMGRAFTIRGGRRAVDHLLEHSLTVIPVNGTRALGFPLDVEAHPNMFLAEALLEPEVPLDHAFTHQGSRWTLQDVVEGAHLLFRPKWATAHPNRLPWSVIALTRTTSPVRQQWENAWGEPVHLDAVVEIAIEMLERASIPIAQAMRQGRPLTTPAPVHSFTCGGTHMIYSLLTAVRQGYAGRDRLARMREQVTLLVWRLTADVDLIERFYRERARQQPALKHAASWWELDSKLKLLGHAEECLAFAEAQGLITLTSAQQAQRRTAVAAVRRLLTELEGRDLEEARALDRELFRQLVGDTCHARHGLTSA